MRADLHVLQESLSAAENYKKALLRTLIQTTQDIYAMRQEILRIERLPGARILKFRRKGELE